MKMRNIHFSLNGGHAQACEEILRRKILMLASTWNNEYMCKLIRGVKRRIGREQMDLYIFNAYDIVENFDHQKKEREIYQLPNLDDYDGVLVAISSVGNIPIVQELVKPFQLQGKKFLSIEHEFPGIYYAGINNYRAVYKLVEHMIVAHGCRVFNFVGGPEKHSENIERYQAFCDCLKDYHLKIDPDRIAFYTFEYADGIRAYEKWKKEDLHLPDAVICGNDDMAMGYCVAAEKDGYFAPDDFRITGFDNIDEGQHFYPSITSVNRQWEQLGYNSMDNLLNLIAGRECPSRCYTDETYSLNASCGCLVDRRSAGRDYMHLFKRKKWEEFMNNRQRIARQLLCGSRDDEEIARNLQECSNLFHLSGIAVCVNQFFTEGEMRQKKQGYDPVMKLLYQKPQGDIATEKQLIPNEWMSDEEPQAFMLSPLHFLDCSFGYCVIRYDENLMLNLNHRILMESISLALENIRQRMSLHNMNRQLEQLYVRDALTGLYNRSGYGEKATKYFLEQKKKVYLIYLDLDGLKFVNDTYGHAAGDHAILAAAKAIRNVFCRDEIRVRMGGDEFLVIGRFKGEDDILQKEKQVEEYLADYSRQKGYPIILKASMGHAWNDGRDETLESLVQRADSEMYVKKQERKKRKQMYLK